MESNSHPVLLYDGVCGLCNRVVQFVLGRDQGGVFRFAALQSPFAARILRRHGLHPEVQNTLVVVLNLDTSDEQLLVRSDGALYLLRTLRKPWPFIARLAMVLPPALRDLGYRMVAKSRYWIFGKHDTCPLPTPDVVNRFLDVDLSP